MAVDKSYARLGLFVVVTFAVVVATGLFFLQRMRDRAVIDMVTYTTDNVAGLDVGSPVRFRGVPIGRIEEIRIDPRGSIIEVAFEIFIDRLTEVGSNVELIRQQAATGGFAHFRAQTVGNPVTGEAYLLIDIPPAPPPAMTLSFTPKRVYIPAMPSMMGNIQDKVPALMDRAAAALQTLETIVARMPASLDRTDQFFTNVERIIQESQLSAFTADSRKFFATTSEQIGKITTDLDHSLGPGGTLATFVENTNASIAAANLEGTTKTTRDAMNQTTLAADELRRSLPAMRDALMQLRDLARMLEEQPESMIYGPRPTKVKK